MLDLKYVLHNPTKYAPRLVLLVFLILPLNVGSESRVFSYQLSRCSSVLCPYHLTTYVCDSLAQLLWHSETQRNHDYLRPKFNWLLPTLVQPSVFHSSDKSITSLMFLRVEQVECYRSTHYHYCYHSSSKYFLFQYLLFSFQVWAQPMWLSDTLSKMPEL